MYDVIGDVHGQGDKLRELLRRLGYAERAGHWRAPPGRQAVFVGDLIDRGHEQLEVLRIVRGLVDDDRARVVLGNHEFNAIGFLDRSPVTGRPYRPRSDKNSRQHARFLEAVGEDSAAHREWVDWFRTLPFALDLGGLRVVHGWWDEPAVRVLAQARGGAGSAPIADEFLADCYEPGSPIQAARKRLTCGVEMGLPDGCWIEDKEGHRHREVRLAVWRHEAERLREIALVPGGDRDAVPDIAIPAEYRIPAVDGAPILFGHHWFSGPVRLETPKVACVDWSAARQGPLVAYRWDGEAELDGARLVAVGGEVSPWSGS